jgi:hypothetical protein
LKPYILSKSIVEDESSLDRQNFSQIQWKTDNNQQLEVIMEQNSGTVSPIQQNIESPSNVSKDLYFTKSNSFIL